MSQQPTSRILRYSRVSGALDAGASLGEHLFDAEYRFKVIEHDADKPWLVVNQEHHTATHENASAFFTWAHRRWPSPRWTVELDPGQLDVGLGR
jgi:hypothetical protein